MPPARATLPFGSLSATAELFRADGLTLSSDSDTVTAAVGNQVTGPGNIGTGLIDVSAIGAGLLIVNVAAVSGTSPALNFALDVQDAYGNWAALTGPGGLFGTAISGAGTFAAPIAAVTVAAFKARLAWTVGGTAPSFTGVSLNVYGR